MADNTTEIIYVDGEGLKHVVDGLEKKINDKESWKEWSEENESSGDEKDVYIGERNTVANEFPDGSTPPTEDVYRAKAYSFGKDNITTYSYNYNISESFLKSYTPTAVHIGNSNTIAGEGVNVGKQNKVSEFGIALGQRNNAANASLALGGSAKADHGSFTFSTLAYNATADNNSFAVSIGGTATADAGSFLIAACGGSKSNAMGGSIGIGDNLSSQRGSIAIVSGGTNTADSAGVILGHHTLSGTNGGIAIGHSSISADHGAITLGLQNVSADSGAIAIGRNCSADTGALVFGTENISAFKGGIAIGRGSGVSAKTGAISLGLGSNNAEEYSIAIGMNRNNAIYASVSIGDSNCSENKSMTLGEQQFANGSSISLGIISTNTDIDLNSELNVLVYTQSSYKYIPHVKFKECAVVTGTWSGDTFTESDSGKSKAIKTDSGKYYSHYSRIPLSELTITHIDGIRNASTGALEVYGTPINSRTSDPSSAYNSPTSHTTNWIEITNSERANISIQNLNELLGRAYYGSTGHSITIGGGSRAYGGSVAINAMYRHPFSTSIATTTINGVYVPSEMNVIDNTGYNAYASGNAIAIGHNTYSSDDSIALNANATATYGSICIGLPETGRQAFATGGSIVLGNGSKATTGSIAIGRYNSANSAYTYGNSNSVTNGAIAIGDNNVGNGWSFIGGWKNTASGAGHALIFGHDNYSMVYETNIFDQIHSTPSSKVYNQVFSTIFGTSNKSYGRFHFVHGLYNTVGHNVNSMSEDNERINDGMCVAIGKYNIATRNYDMAIGYKAVADGVVDWLQQYDSVTDKYYPAGGQNFAMHDSTAVGAKNFALINSIVYGISNIGMHDTQVVCQFTDNGTSNTNYEHESYKQLFRNYLVCTKVTLRNNGKLLGFARNNVNDSYLELETNSENTYSHIDDNIISLANISLNSKENASRNIIRSSTIKATGSKIFSDNIIIGNEASPYSGFVDYSIGNVEYFDKNILLGKTKTNVSNTFAMSDNIILGSYSNVTNIASAHSVTTNLFSYNSKVTLSGSIDCSANVLFSDSTLTAYLPDSTYYRTTASYNFLMRSALLGTSSTKPIIPSTGSAPINLISNFLVGTYATDCYETISLASGDMTYGPRSGQIALLTNTAQSFNVGNNTISSAFNANVIGHGNTLSAVTNSFIFGRSNVIQGSYHSSLTSVYDPVADNIIVFGEQNKVLVPKPVERIRIFGINNIIDSPNPSLYNTALNDLTIFGNDNKTFPGIGHADRDFIFGSRNTLLANVCDGFVFGSENTIGASVDDASGIVYSGMMSLGSNNVVQNGSYAFALGGGNVSTGHHSMSFGLQLQTNEFQAVIGKYNKPLSGTKRYSTSEDKNLTPVDITAGAAFVVGNGYADPGTVNGTPPYQYYSSYQWRDESHIHRSNAMVVWQNGDVEATDFILKYNGKKYRLTDILDAIGVDLSNVEEVINDN